MSRPIPNATLGGYRPNQVKINSIGIGIDDDTLDSLNLNSSQFMVVGGQTNDVYSMIVDNEGIAVNSSIEERASYSNYSLFVDGNIYINGKVDTLYGTLSNIAGGGSGSACNFWMPVRRDIPSSTNIFYDGNVNIANESQSRSNTYRVNIVDSANYSINNAQLAIQNQVGSIARTAILGYSNLSPVIINSSTAPIEFHAGRTKTYFDSVYRTSNNLPIYTSNNNAPHLVINADGNVGIKISPNPPLTYNLRTVDGQTIPQVTPTVISNKPADLHVDGTTYSCNVLMYDYESRSIKNVDDLYIRKVGVTLAASQVEPGYFAPGNYTFRSNVSIGGPIENDFSLSVNGKMHITDQLYADKAFLTSNLVAQDTLQVNGTTYFEGDVIANENVQINQNLVVWGGIYADSNSIQTIVPGGNNSNTTVPISFVGYVADGWSNIYPQGAGFTTPGKAGFGINSQYDTVPAQVSVISRDSNIYGLSLLDKTNYNYTKAFFIGHQRSNIIDGVDDASVIFATPSSTSPYFNYAQNSYAQNMYFYPGKYDKTILGNNTAADNSPPTFSLYETGQAAINSFKPNSNLQLYVNGSIGFSSNLYVVTDPTNPTKLAQFKYGPVVGITNDIGVSYNDTTAPYVAINREPDKRYGLSVSGGIQSDNYYTQNNRKGAIWMDSTTANADTSATTTNGLYAISKVGIGINQPSYILDIQAENSDIGNDYGTYVRLSKSTLDESFSNTGIRFDGMTRPWFTNVEDISTAITRYHVGCSTDVYNLVKTADSTVTINWASNTYNTYAIASNLSSNLSYVNTVITTSNLTVNSSNIVNNSNIFNIYNIINVSNVTSNITSNINNIPNIASNTYTINSVYTTTVLTGLSTTLTTSSNYSTPSAPTTSNIINTSNLINTSNITNTSNKLYYLNTSNYVYSSNNTGLMIQNDNTKGIYGHQVVVGGNASLINNSYNNPNPNPNAILTVNGDTSIMGNLNVTGLITANNTVNITTPGRSNVPTIQANDLFISGKDVFINPTNKMYVNYTKDMMEYATETTNQAVLNVYQDSNISSAPVPIAHFVAEGDNAYIEIVSKAINKTGGANDGTLRIGILPKSDGNQVIGFQDSTGTPYMTFGKLGNTARGMGINTNTPTAQLHIVNNTNSLTSNMLKLTYDNGSSGDTANYTPNITFEKQFAVGGDTYRKQWLVQGPTYGTDLYDQLSFKFVKIITDTNKINTITSNTVLSITSNGCIGINNTTPTYLLDIVSSNIGDERNHGIRLWNKMNLDTAQLAFQSGDSPDIGGDTVADYVMYSCNSEFIFRQRKSGSPTNPLFYFNSNASLGINTNPSIYYDVNLGGTLNVTKAIYLNGTELFSTANTSGSTIAGTSNIYLLPAVTSGGGIVINGTATTGNLFHIFNDQTNSANMTVYDSILDTASVYYRNTTSSSEFNVYQMYTSNARFGLSYKNTPSRIYSMPTNGLSSVFYIDGVQGTNYQEHDVTFNGNLSLKSSTRGTPNISFGSNGTITGNDRNGSLYIMPGYGSNVGIGTTLPRSMMDVFGNLIVSGNVGIGTTLPKERFDVYGNMNITGKIVPSQCNVFDIGSSNYRFRDIYLSGNTIDLDGTLLQRDNITGGLKILNNSGSLLDTSVKNLYVGSNVGIGTTIIRKQLDVIGDTIISGNIGIGTTLPVASLHVQGNTYFSSNVGIGTTQPNALFQVKGEGRFNNIRIDGGTTSAVLITYSQTSGSMTLSKPIYCTGGTYLQGGSVRLDNGSTTAYATLGFDGSNAATLDKSLYVSSNLGIGTTTPRQKFDVIGNSIVSGNIGIGTTTTNGFAMNVVGTANISSTVTAPIFAGNLAGIANSATIASNALGLTGTPNITVGNVTGNLFGIANSAIIASNALGLSGTPNITISNLSASAATISGTLVTSNLTVLGSNTTFNTYIVSTSNVSISNVTGTGPALSVSQKGGYPVADFYNIDVSTTIPALRIAGNGNIGIGTTLPVASLHVQGNTYFSSNVGIGTTIAREVLDVSGGIRGNSLKLDNGTSSYATISYNGTQSAIDTPCVINGFVRASALRLDNGGGGYMTLSYDIPTGQALLNKTFLVSGNIGIGTTTTNGFAMNVVGTANISSTVTAPIFAGNLAGVANSATIASNALGLTGTPNITISNLSASAAMISGTLITSNLTVLGSNTTVNTYTISTSNVSISNITGTGPALSVSQKGVGSNYPIADFYDVDVSTTIPVLRIADGGNIGIGTSLPSYKLDVYGNARITGVVTFDSSVSSSSFIGNLAGVANSATIASNALGLSGTPNITVGNVTGNLFGIANSAIIASNALGLTGTPNITVGNVTGNLFGIANSATIASNALGLTGTPNITVGNVTGNLFGIANSAIIASNALGLSGTPNITISNLSASSTTISGTLITSNLTVLGSNTTINTYIVSTSNVSISNVTGTGPALNVSQKGVYSVADFYNIDVSTTIPALRIAGNGNIGIGTTILRQTFDVIGSAIVSGNVGIGITVPTKKLDITGDINFTGDLYKNGALYTGSSQWGTSGSNIYYTTGNVGIGTSTPTQKLEVNGAVKASSYSGRGALPIGTIIQHIGNENNIPTGYFLCDGTNKSKTDYPELYNALVPYQVTCTISQASPAVLSFSSSVFLKVGDKIYFTTTGTLPSPLTAKTLYYIKTVVSSGATYNISSTSGGTAINTTTTGSGIHTCLHAPYGLLFGTFPNDNDFYLPDFRGAFLRSWAGAEFTPSPYDTGRTLGTVQLDEVKSHNHTINNIQNKSTTTGLGSGGSKTAANDAWSDNNPTSYYGGTETRPVNYAVITLILHD